LLRPLEADSAPLRLAIGETAMSVPGLQAVFSFDLELVLLNE
jgi:hypothetical protein